MMEDKHLPPPNQERDKQVEKLPHLHPQEHRRHLNLLKNKGVETSLDKEEEPLLSKRLKKVWCSEVY
jgi:hypothetical protein